MQMLNFKPFQRLNAKQWWWLWCAYWRLWPTLLRIKFKQNVWLISKISFADADTTPKVISQGTELTNITQLHESIRLAARLHIFKADCLPKSIVLADMLASHSHAARVFIGVSRNANGLASHAWVELNGVMLGEPESVVSDFTALKR